MLEAVSTPVNASPRSGLHSFHYAPASTSAVAPSPRQSPARLPAALSRRQSAASSPLISTTTTTTTIASPSFARPKRYVGVDAATQYSPMELVDYATGAPLCRPAPAPSPADIDRLEPPPMPGPKPMALPDDPPATVASHPIPAKPAKSIPPAAPKQQQQPSGSQSQLAAAVAVPAAAVPAPASSPTAKRRNSQGPGSSSVATPADAVQNPSALAKRPKPETALPKILPERYELCAVEDVVVLIAHMLGELIETNDALALKSGHLTRFHSRTAPGISVLDYLHRLAKHATLSPPLLLSMVYYIDRLCALYPEFTINTLTVHRFLITAATVAAKGLSDAFWNNSTYARVGGVRVAELKLLELEFLYRVDWKIVPNPEVLVAYYRGLVERCPGFQLEEDDNEDDDSEVIDDEDDDELDDEEEIEGGTSKGKAAITNHGQTASSS
ncbi:cyclin-domain-containing protein [Lasiosphaeria miniovina]|uniref:Cyclin-domain-containing protein n=1 Tax=Lasiosphaeria miniovina TaxID=1954250 RepID=A0AA40A034_9PEZI|nr:cyclin-domain-containing protein [Lasiosphaeria miniovina]KAK0706812.1 cyclin-domain-containing protein [Lasiosphaeria miniovina]